MKKPWTDGAKAYHEADSIQDIFESLGRKRNRFTVIIRHDTHGVDGVPCASCGIALELPYPVNKDDPIHKWHTDNYAFVDVSPKERKYAARHYYCAWGGLMDRLYKVYENV